MKSLTNILQIMVLTSYLQGVSKKVSIKNFNVDLVITLIQSDLISLYPVVL